MKKTVYLSLFVFTLFISASNNTFSKLNSTLPDSSETCIVSGELIEGDGVKYTYLNNEVKFCCEGCEKSFKKNPEKYIGAAALWCTVCDEGDAKKDLSLVNDGVKYYFCAEGCQNKFSNDPDSYLKNY